jgi:hypothetical protein
MTREELDNEIEWFLNLRDAVEDGQIEDALKAIEAAIKLRRRQKQFARRLVIGADDQPLP